MENHFLFPLEESILDWGPTWAAQEDKLPYIFIFPQEFPRSEKNQIDSTTYFVFDSEIRLEHT